MHYFLRAGAKQRPCHSQTKEGTVKRLPEPGGQDGHLYQETSAEGQRWKASWKRLAPAVFTYHSELLEVFPEFCLTTVVRDPTNKNFIGFVISPGSFLLQYGEKRNRDIYAVRKDKPCKGSCFKGGERVTWGLLTHNPLSAQALALGLLAPFQTTGDLESSQRGKKESERHWGHEVHLGWGW